MYMIWSCYLDVIAQNYLKITKQCYENTIFALIAHSDQSVFPAFDITYEFCLLPHSLAKL